MRLVSAQTDSIWSGMITEYSANQYYVLAVVFNKHDDLEIDLSSSVLIWLISPEISLKSDMSLVARLLVLGTGQGEQIRSCKSSGDILLVFANVTQK